MGERSSYQGPKNRHSPSRAGKIGDQLSQSACDYYPPIRYTAGDCPGEIVSVKATDPRASENAPSGGKKPKCKRGGGQAFGIIAAAHSIQVNRDFERVTNQLHMRKEREERRKKQGMIRDRTEVETGQLDEVEPGSLTRKGKLKKALVMFFVKHLRASLTGPRRVGRPSESPRLRNSITGDGMGLGQCLQRLRISL